MRIRITFTKRATLRYTGHLDLHRIWERTCRRASLPISYSQGFHPQPRISLASALPLGMIGMAELVDIYLEQDLPLQEVQTNLQSCAPPGLLVNSIIPIQPNLPALQTLVTHANYSVIFLDPQDPSFLASGISRLLNSPSLPRQRRGKEYDLKPFITSLSIDSPPTPGDLTTITMRLTSSPSATGRPEEVLAELGILPEHTRITRTSLELKEN